MLCPHVCALAAWKWFFTRNTGKASATLPFGSESEALGMEVVIHKNTGKPVAHFASATLPLPAASEELLIQMMKQKLQAQSEDEPIADLLL